MKHENESTPVVSRRRGKIKVRDYHNPQRPHLRYYISFREAGRAKRQFFETKEQAKAQADFKNKEVEQNGVEHAEFPTWLRVMAHEATAALQPFGKTIRDAAAHYLAYLKATARSCSAEQLVEEMLAKKKADKMSERHVDNLKSRLSYFSAKFNGKLVAAITTREIDDWLGELPVAPSTRNCYRNIAIQAFNFAIKRGYAVENPAAKTDKVKTPDGDIGILSVTQTARLLESSGPELLPYIAIGAFAGLRSSEIERLDWSDINFESGLIKVEARKGTRKNTRRRRFERLEPNPREWIQPHRTLKGNVPPTEDFRELFDTARARGGLLRNWPINALRHSYGSYHLAHFNDVNVLAIEMGNSPEMIFNHYRELVRPKDAEQYWKIK